jgi:hypothetical protein
VSTPLSDSRWGTSTCASTSRQTCVTERIWGNVAAEGPHACHNFHSHALEIREAVYADICALVACLDSELRESHLLISMPCAKSCAQVSKDIGLKLRIDPKKEDRGMLSSICGSGMDSGLQAHSIRSKSTSDPGTDNNFLQADSIIAQPTPLKFSTSQSGGILYEAGPALYHSKDVPDSMSSGTSRSGIAYVNVDPEAPTPPPRISQLQVGCDWA